MRNPDILTHSNAQTMYVPINFEGYYEKIMRAGSPISMKGKLANDNTAMGILLDDVTREYPMGEIVILGFVDYEIAQNASGITLTPEAKAAMKNITFVGDLESGSSGGGVSPEEVTAIVKENFPGGVGYEETVIVQKPLIVEWDGDTTGRTPNVNGQSVYYKVSDIILTTEQCYGCELKHSMYQEPYVLSAEAWEYMVADGFAVISDDITLSGEFACVRKAGVTATIFDNTFKFIQTGIYFYRQINPTAYIEYMKFPAYLVDSVETVTHKIEDKFLPEFEIPEETPIVFTVGEDGETVTCSLSPEETANLSVLDFKNRSILRVSGDGGFGIAAYNASGGMTSSLDIHITVSFQHIYSSYNPSSGAKGVYNGGYYHVTVNPGYSGHVLITEEPKEA